MFDYSKVKSLFDKSCQTVVSSLWNSTQMIKLFKTIIYIDKPRRRRNKEEGIIIQNLNDIVESLCLPRAIKLYIKNFIAPMTLSVIQFIVVSQPVLVIFSEADVIIKFVWSEKGVLDFAKTSELIIQNNASYPRLCFDLACKFCLEDYVYELEIPSPLYPPEISKFRGYRYPPNNCCGSGCESNSWCKVCHKAFFASSYIRQSIIIEFWAESLKKIRAEGITVEEIIADLSPQTIFVLVWEIRDISLLKFFLEKLSGTKKVEIIELYIGSCASSLGRGLIVQYLLLSLPLNESIQVAKKNAYAVLACFLDWTCLELFLSSANELLTSLSNQDYRKLILDMCFCLKFQSVIHNYENLFMQFWDLSPASFKHYLYDCCLTENFFIELMVLNNASDIIFEKILSSIPIEIRKQMIFNRSYMELCVNFLRNDKLNALKIFVLNCIPNKVAFRNFLDLYKDQFRRNKVMRRKLKETVTPWFEFRTENL